MALPSWINQKDLANAMKLLAQADDAQANALFDAMKAQGPTIIEGPTFFAVVAQLVACMLDSTRPGSERRALRELIAAAAAYHAMHEEGYGRPTEH